MVRGLSNQEDIGMTRHGCGGELQPDVVTVVRNVSGLNMVRLVEGFRCSLCGETEITRDTAEHLERTFLRLTIDPSGCRAYTFSGALTSMVNDPISTAGVLVHSRSAST